MMTKTDCQKKKYQCESCDYAMRTALLHRQEVRCNRSFQKYMHQNSMWTEYGKIYCCINHIMRHCAALSKRLFDHLAFPALSFPLLFQLSPRIPRFLVLCTLLTNLCRSSKVATHRAMCEHCLHYKICKYFYKWHAHSLSGTGLVGSDMCFLSTLLIGCQFIQIVICPMLCYIEFLLNKYLT